MKKPVSIMQMIAVNTYWWDCRLCGTDCMASSCPPSLPTLCQAMKKHLSRIADIHWAGDRGDRPAALGAR